MSIRNKFYSYSASVIAIVLLCACSSTSKVPEGDRLYIGMEKIKYENYERNEHAVATQEEIEAALAAAPNGALFGSSYYRTPFPYALWIYNAFSDSKGGLGKWMAKSFGKKPVLMSWVNPELRASVAQQVLIAHGYFRGKVSYQEIKQRNPKESKIGYTVNMGHLFQIDSLAYINFPASADSLIQVSRRNAKIKNGDPFDVNALEAERTRLTNLFRNHGYYYYQNGYASYFADTVTVPGKALLHFQMADGIPESAQHKWYIGKVGLQLRKSFMEPLRDTVTRGGVTVSFHGKRPPIRPHVILKNVKVHPGSPYRYQDYLQSADKLSSMGLFTMVDFKYTPKDSTQNGDTLDLALNCILDKPYDFYVETNMKGKTSGSLGPEVVVGLTKRNAFRGGEKLDVKLNGMYEWQTSHGDDNDGSKIHSYEYGASASLELPRLLLPFHDRHPWFTTPSTILKVSSDVLNRRKYFKRHVVSGEFTYRFQSSANSVHELSPLVLSYEYMKHTTDTFQVIMSENPYLLRAMEDQFVPKMRYSYTYTSPATYKNPIYWNFVISEASNLISLGYMAAGKKWGQSGKKMFKNPYAQFVKLETDFSKSWAIGEYSSFVAHAAGGVIWSYGNSLAAPYSEQFYVGGANSIRAFTVRSLGPGSYHTDSKGMSYLDQTGDIKVVGNLEYRPRLFGNLYGAIFLDAGNIWAIHDDNYREGSKFEMRHLLKEMALGTGVGIRYDLDYFVIRLDWGVGLHVPYKSGFYNIGKFKDGQSIHLAIGYPF